MYIFIKYVLYCYLLLNIFILAYGFFLSLECGTLHEDAPGGFHNPITHRFTHHSSYSLLSDLQSPTFYYLFFELRITFNK